MPANSAARHNPDLKAFYDRLIASGKKPKVAITAVMRKLAILANTLVGQNRLWEPHHASLPSQMLTQTLSPQSGVRENLEPAWRGQI